MKKMAKILSVWILGAAALVFAAPIPENPATGIWIQQIGDIVDQPSTNATLYYTKYVGDDRVKSIDYFYDGLGYLRLLNKQVVCRTGGADGIMHHPGGDLIVAGQGTNLYKVKKNSGSANSTSCVARTSKTYYKTATTPAGNTAGRGGSGSWNNGSTGNGFWHVMVDPKGKYVWADGMPGPLVRYYLGNDTTTKGLADVGYEIELRPAAGDRNNRKMVTTVIWDGAGRAFYTYSNFAGGGCETDIGGRPCDESLKAQWRAGSHFGYFTDSSKVVIRTAADSAQYLGRIGDTVITGLGMKTLIDSLEGAHGGTYDPYSHTIFLFGGSKIRQIKIDTTSAGRVVGARVVATIDLRDFFFPEDSHSFLCAKGRCGYWKNIRLKEQE